MKRLGIIAFAMALLVTLSQCKKEKTEASNNESVKVPITLNVSGGNGSRVNVNTQNGKVTFENGDALYVASNGVYVGMLIYNGIKFSGEVTEPTEGQKLHFYFLGNVDTEETLTEGTSTGCSVVISDQTENLPVISYNTSRENYEVGRTDYNATLLNKCALVKFNVTSASNTATCISGMNNKVTIDFTSNEFTYSQEGDGVITLAAGNGEKWAILLPQEALEEGSAYSEDGNYTGTRDAIPAIIDNGYMINGVAVTINTPVSVEAPTGAINGLFTINSNGDQVYFSQGNLQYQASTNTWRFAENQWDYVGHANLNTSSTYSGWIDLFSWGTSGYHDSNDPYNVYYQPWSISTTEIYANYNSFGYGPSTNMASPNLTGGSSNYDWGVYNPICNGGNTINQWRTLTIQEWQYIFNTRTIASGIRYAKAQVNNTCGVILLPDDWSSSIYGLNSSNSGGGNYTSNKISASEWTTLENAGAVFLPAGGGRHGTSMTDPGSRAWYWSASYHNRYIALNICFWYYGLNTNNTYGDRCDGSSVRLVKDYNR